RPFHAGRVVCRPRQTLLQPARLAVRAGLDGALYPDCRRWLAYLATRPHRLADEVVVGADGAELPVDAGLFRRAPDRAGARRDPADARRHPRLHRERVAAGSRGGVAVCALCRLGGLRLAAERFDLDVELTRRANRRFAHWPRRAVRAYLPAIAAAIRSFNA